MRRERLFLEDNLSAADTIAQFMRGQCPDSFSVDRLVRSAVVHQLTVIGETVAHLSAELTGRYPEVPWADIRGLRNVVVHNYFGIDWAEVWRAATEDVPALHRQIAEILRTEFPDVKGAV